MASPCLNEQGWHTDVIELQLAYAESNEVRRQYDQAQRLAERRGMIQARADHLDHPRLKINADASGGLVTAEHVLEMARKYVIREVLD